MNAQPLEVHEGLVPIRYMVFGLFAVGHWRLPETHPEQPLIKAVPGGVTFTSGRADQKDHVRLEVHDEPAPTVADGFEEYASVDMTWPEAPMRLLWEFSTPLEEFPTIEAVPRWLKVQAWVTGRDALKARGMPADGTCRWLIRVGPGTVEPQGESWYVPATRLT